MNARLRVLGAFLDRDFGIAVSYRLPFVFDVVAAAFTVLSFLFVSRLVPERAVPGGYLAFVMVGLALGAFLQAGVSRVGGNVRQEQVQGTLETTLATGVSVSLVAAGSAAYPLAAASLRALAYAGLAAAVGVRAPGASWGLALTALVCGSLSFAGLGLFGAGLVLVIRQAAAATGWLVAVLTLLGGALFPPELLPGWAQRLSALSPFTHTLAVARTAILEGTGFADNALALAALVGLTVAFVGAGLAGFAWALGRARRTGGLAQY